MTEQKKKEYIVVEPIRCDGKRREVGAKVELDPEVGDPLIAQGIVKEPEPARAAGKQLKEKGDKA